MPSHILIMVMHATAPCSAHNVLHSISIHCIIGTLIFMYKLLDTGHNINLNFHV